MKLHILAPYLSEADIDDSPFAPPQKQGVSVELLNNLRRKDDAITRELWSIKIKLYHMVDHTTGCINQNAYPGGIVQARSDEANKKVIQITFDRDWGKGKIHRVGRRGKIPYVNHAVYLVPNTPAGQEFASNIQDIIVRIYDPMNRHSRIYAKLLRDKRTLSNRRSGR